MSVESNLFNDRRLTEKEAADVVKKSPKTLREWRCKGIGPRYIDDGTIGYLLSVLHQWNLDHQFSSTAEAQVRKRQEQMTGQSPVQHPKISTHSATPAQPSAQPTDPQRPMVPRGRRLYHRITNWEREVLNQAYAARQSNA